MERIESNIEVNKQELHVFQGEVQGEIVKLKSDVKLIKGLSMFIATLVTVLAAFPSVFRAPDCVPGNNRGQEGAGKGY